MNIINKITLAGLKKNRTRTIVTIIGVILSAAMITAVTTLIASLQGYAIDFTIADAGNWHAVLHNGTTEDLNTIRQMVDIEGLSVTQSAGYALLPGSQNDYKPYLHVLQLDEAALTNLPVHLQSGRLPVQADEVLVSEQVSSNAGVRYQVGDRLTLQLGQRLAENGNVLGQKDEYQGKSEQLTGTVSRSFTVVGICSRPSGDIEGFSSPGYTLISPLKPAAINSGAPLNVYFRAIRPAAIYGLTDRIGATLQLDDSQELEYNNELLRFLGVSNDQNFLSVLYGLAAILLALIMVGSVSLIYNSFSISVSERRKQFGLLSGAGATSQQLRRSVFFEALVVGGVGIPLGVLAGVAGIGVTIYFLRDALASLANPGSSGLQVPFALVVSLPAIGLSLVVASITILISAYIPARRTAKLSAMDAIRQTTDIKLTAKQVKTSRITRRLFGVEGDFGLKNLKRNRRRYRSTVISLFISVVLFVSAFAFSTYLRDSVLNVYENTDYDLSYFLDSERLDAGSLAAYQSILALDSIKQGSFVRQFALQAELPREQVSADYYQLKVSRGLISDGDRVDITVYVYSVDSTSFAAYAQELGLNVEQLRNAQSPAGIVIDKQHFYDAEQGRYLNTRLFGATRPTNLPLTVRQGESESETIDVGISALVDAAPFGVPGFADRDTINLIVDESLATAALQQSSSASMFFAATNAGQAEVQVKEILLAAGLSTSRLYNVADALQANRNLISIISVFSFGFIILMSLITIANVFNTISTNVNLRRREFAMLKSVGMTERSLKKMLDFECIFYGLKALLYGLPVSIMVTYLIHQSIIQGVETPFYLPVGGILISVISVFLVVFASMKFSREKVRQENILDALKNENL